MALLYKFRSTKSLLNHKELINSELHFSSPELLNDPMEKIKNFVFNGEEVNWKCLIRTFVLDYYFKILFDGFDNDRSIVSYYKLINKEPVPKIVNDIDYIIECILSEEFIKSRFKEFVGNDISLHTLIDFLYAIMPLVYKHLNKLGDIKMKNDHFNIDINKFHEAIKREKPFNLKYAENVKWKKNRLDRQLLIKSLYPQIFVNILISYCFAPYYVLSLSSDFSKPSMWAHYADNHQGVCLIFNSDTTNNKEYLNIQYFGDRQEVKSINYNLIHTVNVFTHMGAVGGGIVYCLHNYKNEKSQFWSNLNPSEFIKEQDSVLINELGLTKSPDWKYENEKRIFVRNEDNNTSINLKYDEQQLVGLIFGINIKDDDECEIIKILKSKKNLNKDFKLYKAFYNFDCDIIDKCNIDFKFIV